MTSKCQEGSQKLMGMENASVGKPGTIQSLNV